MAKISVSDLSIKTPIDELAKGIECQVFKKLQAHFFQFNLVKELIMPNCRTF